MTRETAFRIQHDSKKSNYLAIVVCIFTSLKSISFGYERVVAADLFLTDDFIDNFCVGYGGNTHAQCISRTDKAPENWTTFTTLFTVVFLLGCIFGSAYGGWFCAKFGRRSTIFSSCFIFCIGVIFIVVTPRMNHTFILVGRFFCGVGLAHAFIVSPIYNAECSPREIRGMLSAFMHLSSTGGAVLGGISMFMLEKQDSAWRFNLLASLLFCVIVMAGVFWCPESPRWTYQKIGEKEAHVILRKLRHKDDVSDEVRAIGMQVAVEGASTPYTELWMDRSLRKRLMIAIALFVLQQLAGLNFLFAYGGQIFRDVSGNGLFAVLTLAIVHFVSTIPGLYFLDCVGRRFLLLIGAVGMTVSHLAFALSFTFGCEPAGKKANCTDSAALSMLFFASFSVFAFSISWGIVPGTYTAELFPTNVRSRAVSIATMASWITGLGMIWFVKLIKIVHIDGVFYIFAAFTFLCFIVAYFVCLETKGILLEDVEKVFEMDERKESRRSQSLQCIS